MVKRLILLVLAVFAVAMAVPSTRQQIQDNAFTPVTDEIGRRLVPRRLQVMADQLDVRLSRAEGLPGNFEGWLRRDYSGPELDPWGNAWYIAPGAELVHGRIDGAGRAASHRGRPHRDAEPGPATR
jgi:hypothetical protein